MVNEFHHAVSVGEIVHRDGLGEHVFSNTPHLNGICREKAASVNESRSLKRNRVVSFVHDKHSGNLFITVDDEISTKFKTILLLFG